MKFRTNTKHEFSTERFLHTEPSPAPPCPLCPLCLPCPLRPLPSPPSDSEADLSTSWWASLHRNDRKPSEIHSEAYHRGVLVGVAAEKQPKNRLKLQRSGRQGHEMRFAGEKLPKTMHNWQRSLCRSLDMRFAELSERCDSCLKGASCITGIPKNI